MKIVSNNDDLSKVARVEYKRVGMGEEDSAIIFNDHPDDELLCVNDSYKPYVTHIEEIEDALQPKLNKNLNGPFKLAVCNHGGCLEGSFVIFDMRALDVELPSSIILSSDSVEWVSKSFAIFPFVELFKAEILKEAVRAERLIASSRVSTLDRVRNQRDQRTVLAIMSAFSRKLADEGGDDTVKLVGKEAFSDSLASSMSASKAFYDVTWLQIKDFFEPSIRQLGEQHALGNISLDKPFDFQIK